MNGELHFSVDAKLLFELGEQLVARRSVALAELVKNSYDADAKSVTVALNGVTTKKGSITVSDDGLGMTLEDIQARWMRIAVSDKAATFESKKYKRPRTGAKGIGRFASRKLGTTMLLTSIARLGNGKQKTQVTFDWNRFTVGLDLDDIPVNFSATMVSPTHPTGVSLAISGLHDHWTADDVKEVERDLIGLVSPFSPSIQVDDSRHDPGFSFELLAPEFPGFEGKLQEKFLEAAWGRLSGHVGPDARAYYTLKVRGGKSLKFTSPVKFPSLGAAQCQIHYFQFRTELFRGMPFGVAAARQLAREQAGVRMYMDRFRVFPYGDPGDDWLDLDLDRGKRLTALDPALESRARELTRPMLSLPGTNQLFGAVLLSRRTNPNISLNISRERLIENDAFTELKRFVRLGINWMTIEYARLKAEEDSAARHRVNDPVSRLRSVREEIEGREDLESESKARIVQALELAEADWRSYQNDQISELSMIRVLASVGTMVVVFDHELRAVIDALHGIASDLKELVPSVDPSKRGGFNALRDQLEQWARSVEQQGSQIGLLLSRESRQRKRRLALREVVDSMSAPFQRYMNELGILLINDVPAALRTPPMFECELQSILLNLQTNAIKALREVPTRRIKVSASRENEQLVIIFADTGVGIPAEVRDEVFKPFFTTSEPDPVLGIGTGLGLKIVHDLVETYGGSIRVIEPEKEWSTRFQIKFPLRLE